jgi:RNA polymerase sigma-70 factor, ECF subfamily
MAAAVALSDYATMDSHVRSVEARTRRDERQLARRLRRRAPGSLEAVYERFGPATLGLLQQMLGDRATAEDVLQQVFLEVWQRAEQYDPARAGLVTWIMTIARSRAIDELRRRVPEPRDPGSSFRVLESTRRADSGDVEGLLETWRIAHFLSRLPAGQAELLRRRFYADQTQSQIAEETGIPLGTVKARMVKGLESLRAIMEAEDR